jgi:ribosomal protein S27AE
MSHPIDAGRTWCHYAREWFRLRANAKRCPRCGAMVR